MEPNFLGKITAPSAGVPVQLTSDNTIRACKIVFVTIPGLSGNIYVGGANLDTTTLAGVLIKFNPPSAVGLSDSFTVESERAVNSLVVSDYWLAASVAGEGALVTYFQT
jgi:hypothetical protein